MIKKSGCLGCLAVIVILILFFGGLFVYSTQPPRAYYLVQDIPIGTPRTEVYAILGKPNRTDHNTGTPPCWVYYSEVLRFGELKVVFDDNEQLLRWNYEPF